MVEPAYVCLPSWARTLGPEVGRLCAAAGYAPDPEQQLGLDATFALNAAGRSAASMVVWLACRQNLKTGAIKQTELGWLFITGERLVVHSAHEFDTAREAYRDLKEIIDGTPILRKRILAMHDTPADMSIETTSGARLVFKTRTKGAGVGKSPRKIVLDEGYALVPEHMSALRFSISAQPDPQVIVGSSAAHPESDVLRSFVKRGRAGREDRLAYLEWCLKAGVSACRDGEQCTHVYGESVGCILDDLDALREANPQLGRRLQVQTIRDERVECITAELAAKFGRERAGWHDAPGAGLSPIPAAEWSACERTEGGVEGGVALAFDVTPEGGASIVTFGELGDGVGRGEVLPSTTDGDYLPGSWWLVDRLRQIARDNVVSTLIVDPSGPAGAFITELLADEVLADGSKRPSPFVKVGRDERPPRGKTRLHVVTASEYGQACGALLNDIRDKRIRHYDQKPLNDAVEGARTKDFLDGAWKWSRRDSSVNIAPLIAFTLARHGFAVFGGSKPKSKPFARTI